MRQTHFLHATQRKLRSTSIIVAPLIAFSMMGAPAARADPYAPTWRSSTQEEAQSLTVSADAMTIVINRDGYIAASTVESTAYTAGTSLNGHTIRWPFTPTILTDQWGPRRCSGCSPFHHGLDFAHGLGTAIPVAADGVVISADDSPGDYGTYVVVSHLIDGAPVQTVYAHMITGSAVVQAGDVVAAGDTLGSVGNTGQSTGPHLHFEVRVGGERVDPMPWMLAHVTG